MIDKKNPLLELIKLSQTLAKGEINLGKVGRWASFNPDQRRGQTTLQHSFSICLLATTIIDALRPYYPKLDGELLLRAFVVHDWGEGENGRDKPAPEKTTTDDLAEYQSFVDSFSSIKNFDSLHRAFLLQYCYNYEDLINHAGFSKLASEILIRLVTNNYYEGIIFRIIEIWEYLIYGLEMYYDFSNSEIIKEVIHNNLKKLDLYAEIVTGFKERIYTEEIRTALCELEKTL